MPVNNHRKDEAAEVFDLLHLNSYSMQDQALAEEVLGLFLLQLPAMLQALEDAADPAAWAFATHTLKGSAGAIGARRLARLATELEAMPFSADYNSRLIAIQGAKAAAAEFRLAARGAYSAAR